MLKVATIAAALALPLTSWSLCAQRPVPEQFAAALAFREFVAGDSSRLSDWMRVYDRAGPSVAAVLPRARAIGGHWHLFVIAESWCGDALNSVPYLARLADEDTTIDLRMVRRAGAPELLQAHLLSGRAATPVILLYDERFVERGAWIERPAALRAFIQANTDKLDDEALTRAIRDWRAKDAGRAVLGEVLSLMERQPMR